jgi:hypothetical protein
METPYLFKNAQLDTFDIELQIDSFLFNNLIRFQTYKESTNDTKSLSINSSIGRLEVLTGYNYKIDMDLLNPLVLEKVSRLLFCGSIQSIQTDVFVNFKFLNSINFGVNSLGNFYHQIGIGWINYVRNGSALSLVSGEIPYAYPDRDFCIFAGFPPKRGISLDLDDPHDFYLHVALSDREDKWHLECQQH